MKARVVLSLLLVGSVHVLNITPSRDLKTLRMAGVDPALSAAVSSALRSRYKPNPNPLMNSFVRIFATSSVPSSNERCPANSSP